MLIRASRRAAAAALLLVLALLVCGGLPQQSLPHAAAQAAGRPLQLAIVNQVHFHLEVVAGAMHVLRGLTSAPVTVYLPAKVLKNNWYGFTAWLGKAEGFVWKECKEYDGNTTYDLVWFISPEYNQAWVETVAAQMAPKVGMFMVHNGHIPDAEFKRVKAMAGRAPLLTLAPHVAKNISHRTGDVAPDWILPIYPYVPANTCLLADIQVCARGRRQAPASAAAAAALLAARACVARIHPCPPLPPPAAACFHAASGRQRVPQGLQRAGPHREEPAQLHGDVGADQRRAQARRRGGASQLPAQHPGRGGGGVCSAK